MEKRAHKYEDELSLEEVIESSVHLLLWLKTHALKLIVIAAITCSIAVFWATSQEERFAAELSFMLNDENNPQISGVSGILNQLGLPAPSGKYNVDKLLEISKSNNLVTTTLFSWVTIDGKNDLLANHFIDILKLGEKWGKKDTSLEYLRFKGTDQNQFNDKEKYAIKALCYIVVGSKQNRSNALFSTDYGKTDYIMTFNMRTPSEDLSMAFVNEHYNQVSNFYIEKARAKNQSIYDLILSKRDSINRLVSNTALDIAQLRDKSSGSFRNSNTVKIGLLEGTLAQLQTASEEVVKHLSSAEYALDASTPLIQLLDRPHTPLSVEKPSYVKYGLFGFSFGILVYLIFLFVTHVLGLARRQLLS